MAARLRRTLLALVGVVVLVPLVAGSALADTAPSESYSFTGRGLSANAGEYVCTTSGDVTTCTGEYVSIFSGSSRMKGGDSFRGTQVCVDRFTDTFNEVTGEYLSTSQYGCTTDLGEGTMIERDLSSATIAPTTVTLTQFSCDYSFPEEPECTEGGPLDVVVEGTFTATSPAVRSSNRSTYDDGVCWSRDMTRGTNRDAIFVGTIDGESVEYGGTENSSGNISNASYMHRGGCVAE